ncbi:MAG: AAA family ATPase [Rubrivivax sp.]|nr:AAA family ATPase [Rubrivivax sp.]
MHHPAAQRSNLHETEPAVELTAAEQLQLVRACLAQWRAPGDAPPRHVETHISHVLLLGGHAYKFKKVLATSFLDQSTLALRRRACLEELRLNRRLAPDLYLDVVQITGSLDQPALGGLGPVLDVAVKMRAFDESNLWDRLAARGELRAVDIDDLAGRVARLHAGGAAAPADGRFGTPAAARTALLDSLRDLQALAARSGWPAAGSREQLELEQLAAWEPAAFERAAPAMAVRLAAGRVRECHGDLHLGNVAREGAHALVFDGIEFNDAFRWLDVMDEAAFMTMDLHAHGLPALGHRFLNAYLEHGGDYDGLRVLGYYLVHRALVRAKVAQLRAAQAAGTGTGAGNAALDEALATAARYLRTAAALARARRPALFITHGLSGSGKTTLTQGFVEASGAVRVRADVERKRLAGLQPQQGSRSLPGEGLYTAAMNEATQARLLECANVALQGGWPVVLDATFIRRQARDQALACAAQHGVPFVILRFTAEPQALRTRIRQRLAEGRDASEADEAVLEAQMQALEPLQPDERVHTVEVPAADAPDAQDAAGAGEAAGPAPTVDWTRLLAPLQAELGTEPA